MGGVSYGKRPIAIRMFNTRICGTWYDWGPTYFSGLYRTPPQHGMVLNNRVTPIGTPTCRDNLNCPTGPVLDTEFVPSRGRAISALSATGVAGTHPTGRSLLSFIVGEPDSMGAHVRAALAV